jgi:hypothetical protein
VTDFTVPTDFVILGHDGDGVGTSHIRLGKAIGGGATADGVDETDTWLRNARWMQTQGNRARIFQAFSYGDASPQAVLFSTADPAYQDVFTVPVEIATGRDDYTVTFDFQNGTCQVQAYTSGGTSRDVVATSEAGATQTQSDVTLSPSAEDTAYLVVRIKAKSGQTGKLFGVRVYEDASSL